MIGATGAGGRGREEGVCPVLAVLPKGNRLALVSSGLATGGPNRREEEGEKAGRGARRRAAGQWRAMVPQRGTRSIYSRRHRHAGAPDEQRCRDGRAGQGPASRCQAAGESWGKAICPFRANVDRDSTRTSRGGGGRVVDVFRHPARWWRQVGAVLSAESMVRLEEGAGFGSWGCEAAWTLCLSEAGRHGHGESAVWCWRGLAG